MNAKYLRLEVVWKDNDMVELQVSANNGRYSGITEVYAVPESILEFANNLDDFPFKVDSLSHLCGEKDSYSYFEMRFYRIGPTGKCGLLVIMEENVATEYRKEEKDKISMELIIEANAIVEFCQDLKTLAKNEAGVAELKAVDKYTNNIA